MGKISGEKWGKRSGYKSGGRKNVRQKVMRKIGGEKRVIRKVGVNYRKSRFLAGFNAALFQYSTIVLLVNKKSLRNFIIKFEITEFLPKIWLFNMLVCVVFCRKEMGDKTFFGQLYIFE